MVSMPVSDDCSGASAIKLLRSENCYEEDDDNPADAPPHTGSYGKRDLRRHLRVRKGHFPAQRQTVCGEGGRGALPPYSPPLLGAPHTHVQGAGHEHALPLCVLEHPRTADGAVRLHRQQRCGRILPSGTEKRTVCHRTPGTLCVCRVGDGRPALVAAQEERHPAARARRILHGAGQNLRAEGGRATGPADHSAGWSHHHDSGGERVRLLWRGQTLRI